MIRATHHLLHYLLLGAVILFLALVLFVYHPKSLHLVSDALKRNGYITFDRIEGSLATGVTLYNVRYQEGFSAAVLELKYNALTLLTGRFEFERLYGDDLLVDVKRLNNTTQGDDSAFNLPVAVVLKRLQLKHLRIVDSLEYTVSGVFKHITFDSNRLTVARLQGVSLDLNSSKALHLVLNATSLDYDKALHVERLSGDATIDSNRIHLAGSIALNRLQGSGEITYNPSYTATVSNTLSPLPQTLAFNATADFKHVALSSTLERLAIADGNLSNIGVTAHYVYGDDALQLKARHHLATPLGSADILHNINLPFDLNITDILHVGIEKSRYPLPYTTLEGRVHYDKAAFEALLESNATRLHVSSNDLSSYTIDANVNDMNLSFIPQLPELLSRAVLSADFNGTFDTNTDTFMGAIKAGTLHSSYEGTVSWASEHLLSDGWITTDGNSEFWRSIPIKNIEALHVISDIAPDTKMLHINSKEISATLFQENTRLNGWGAVATSPFDINGTIGDKRTQMQLHSQVASLYTLVDTFWDINMSEDEVYDLGMVLDVDAVFDEELRLNADIHIPWYLAKMDPERFHYGTDATLEVSYSQAGYRLERYRLKYNRFDFFANKPSHIGYENNRITIKEAWVNDTLKLTGFYDLNASLLNLCAKSDAFRYKGDEGEIEAALHVTLLRDSNQTALEGDINVKKALIRYEADKDKVVTDEDIIVIQEVKPPNQSPLVLNVRVHADTPLRYKTKSFDIAFVPDITLWKERQTKLELLGWVVSDKGWVYSGNSEFEVKHSELYFAGGARIDPLLNLHLLYAIDNKLIDIYATHKLSSPVFLFTSSPAMSQNDIMSYILFGTPATSSFESDAGGSTGINAANVIFGTGLKEMIGDTTGLRVDTLSLLSTSNGNIGFEVGTRINRDMRVVLKNDDIFALILQLSLSDTLRVDVDVKETGQGVNLIYVKDYEDWLK